jgi:hypothetical protein
VHIRAKLTISRRQILIKTGGDSESVSFMQSRVHQLHEQNPPVPQGYYFLAKSVAFALVGLQLDQNKPLLNTGSRKVCVADRGKVKLPKHTHTNTASLDEQKQGFNIQGASRVLLNN